MTKGEDRSATPSEDVRPTMATNERRNKRKVNKTEIDNNTLSLGGGKGHGRGRVEGKRADEVMA